MPLIASDGIQVNDVTDFSIRMLSSGSRFLNAKPARCLGLVGAGVAAARARVAAHI